LDDEIEYSSDAIVSSKRDKKDGSRVPISSKLVADLMRKAGASCVMMLDPHAPQLEGFFDMPVDAIKVNPLFCEWIEHHVPDWQDAVVVSPDEGGTKKSVSVAADLGLEFALIHSRNKTTKNASSGSRSKKSSGSDADSAAGNGARARKASSLHPATALASRGKVYSLSGNVRGKRVIVVDDMIDTGGTLRVAEQVLRREGATDFYVLSTHGIFSAGSYDVIRSIDPAFLRGVVVSNSIPQGESSSQLNKEGEERRFHVLDVSGLVSEYIRRHHYRESVSVLSQFLPVRDIVRPSRRSTVTHAAAAAAAASLADGALNAVDGVEENLADLIVGEEGGLPVPLPQDTTQEESLAYDDEVDVTNGHQQGEVEAEDDAVVEEGEEDAAPLTEKESKQLRNLRKGFRLSSVCWEDRP